MLLLVWACLANLANSQTTKYNLNDLKLKVAENQKVPVSNILFIEVREYGSVAVVYARLSKDSKDVTFGGELSSIGPGLPYIKGSITCTGIGCAECDIEGGFKIEDMYCTCVRRTTEDGRCDMTKSVGF